MMHTLYIIHDRSKTKVGITSRDLSKRLKEYNTHNAHWELVESFNVDAKTAKHIESTVKHFYKARKSSGGGDEWFDIPPDEIAALIRNLLATNNHAPSSGTPILHEIRPNSAVQDAQSALRTILHVLHGSTSVQENSQKPTKDELATLREKKQSLQNKIREGFSKAFALGLHRDMLDNYRIAGISICPPNLKHVSNPSLDAVREAIWRGQGRIEPPYFDHADLFYHLAPLSTGANYAFCSAITFQPYVEIDSDRWMCMRTEISSYAEDVGWIATEHPEWSWYFPEKTTLFLLQPKTPARETARQFNSSFKRFVIEHAKKYQLKKIPRIEDVLQQIIYDDCFPLDVESFDQLNGAYLYKFRQMRLDDEEPEDKELIEVYELLFDEWLKNGGSH